jgi:GxxExxY protein
MEEEYLYKEKTYAIIGACIEVHTKLGAGFLEAVYHKALEMELKKREIPFKSKVKLDVYYGDTKLDKIYVADLICYEEIIIEIKVSAFQHPDHFRQLLNYLKVTGYKIGLLINFGMASLKVKRMINTPSA